MKSIESPSLRDLENERVSELIRRIHHKLRIYGYRRIKIVLRDEYQENINHKRILRLMKAMGIKAAIRRRRYPKPVTVSNTAVLPNLLSRDFHADKPLSKLVTDITYFFVGQERYYLSVVKDLYNGQIVAYHHSRHPDNQLVADTLEKLFQKYGRLDGCILHSDQGGTYTCDATRCIIREHGLIQSMSRKATPLDNASVESFFGYLKDELFVLFRVDSIHELRTAIDQYIDFYNISRPQRRLNGKAPVKFLDERLCA